MEGKLVVDCGCGDGEGTIHFVELGCNVIGIDLEESKIEMAKSNFPHLDFRVASLLHTGLLDKCADIFICSETLEHLGKNQTLKAADEIKRVCKSYACVTVPDNKKICLSRKEHKQYISQKLLKSLFSGWEIVSNSVFYKDPNRKDRGNRVMIFKDVGAL